MSGDNMPERTLEDRLSRLEHDLERSREFSGMLLAFLAYKNVMTLDEFSEWRRWVEATGVHRDETFELGMALLNVEAEATTLLGLRAGNRAAE
jgi:hypothetical protein